MSQQIELSPEEQLDLELTPEEQLDLEERVTKRVELIKRSRAYSAWMSRAKKEIANGRNVGHINANLPPPFSLDEYELKRAIEEGLQ